LSKEDRELTDIKNKPGNDATRK